MGFYNFHALFYSRAHIAEPFQPLLQVNAEPGNGLNIIHPDSPPWGLLEDGAGLESGHAAVMMPDYENGIGLEVVDSHQDAPHHAAKGVGDDSPCVFDDFGITVAQIQGFGQEFC